MATVKRAAKGLLGPLLQLSFEQRQRQVELAASSELIVL